MGNKFRNILLVGLGIVVGVVGIILLAFVAPLTWGFIGVM